MSKKLQKIKMVSEKHHIPGADGPIKITDQMWREACRDGSAAKLMLVNMSIGGKGKVEMVRLSNGSEIPVTDITEKQALDFITMLAPERVWKGHRQ